MLNLKCRPYAMISTTLLAINKSNSHDLTSFVNANPHNNMNTNANSKYIFDLNRNEKIKLSNYI